MQKHNCLLFQLNSRIEDLWEFVSSDKTEGKANGVTKIKVSGNRSTNDADTVRLWTIAGKGISYKSVVDMTEDLNAGKIERVLPEYCSPTIDLI